MDGTLNLVTSIVAYTDSNTNSNPQERSPQHGKTFLGLPIENPGGDNYSVEAGATKSVFSGVRSTSIANDTEFTLTLSSLASNRYRFTHSAGTAPAFRTNRNLTANTHTITIVVNANATITMTSSFADFGAVIVGDIIFIPGTTTGDTAGPFDALNEGYWQVLSTSTTILQLSRLSGTSFEAAAEVVTITANSQLQAFSAAGVQVGDGLNISNGFATSVLQAYTVIAVNPSWFEVYSTNTLPVSAIGIPTTSGIAFYSSLKRMVYVEADQDCVIKLNGDTNNYQRLQPWLSGDKTMVAQYLKVGPAWSLDVENKSTNVLNLFVAHVE